MFLQPRNWSQALRMYSAGGDPPGGGGDPPRPKASELLNQYNGDAVRMAEKLAEVLGDNATLREQRRDLRAEVTTLKGSQAPEGAVILTGDDAAAYQAYQALGKPGDLTKRLADGDAAITSTAQLERDALVAEAAAVAGYKPSVLKDRAGDLPLVVREVTEDGKAVKRAFVAPQGQGEQELTAYAQAQWGDYLPALVASQAQPRQGIAYPTTPGGGGQRPADPVGAFLTQRNERAAAAPNPLQPRAATP
jgi:hypothetical protein